METGLALSLAVSFFYFALTLALSFRISDSVIIPNMDFLLLLLLSCSHVSFISACWRAVVHSNFQKKKKRLQFIVVMFFNEFFFFFLKDVV